MRDEATGYISDVPYTAGFYRDQTPLNLFASLALAGKRWDKPSRLRYLELGCGQGMTLLVLAACYPESEFHGVDMNPEHIAGARAIQAAGGLTNLHFHNSTFGELDLKALPEFDVVASHGVYSWIGEDVRRDIAGILKARLKPGGLFYVSYNAQPGWTVMSPVQRLFFDYAATVPGNSLERARLSAEWIKSFFDLGGRYSKETARATQLVESFKGKPISYLAHEYLNARWQALYVTDVMADMEKVWLTYVGDASPAGNLIELVLPQAARTFLQGPGKNMNQELLKDFFLGTQFRRDIYSKGGLRVARSAAEALSGIKMATAPRQTLKEELAFPGIRLKVEPVHQQLAEAGRKGVLTAEGVLQFARQSGQDERVAFSAYRVLIAAGVLQPILADPAQPAADPKQAPRRMSDANRALLKAGLDRAETAWLASPVFGAAVDAGGVDALALDQWIAGRQPDGASLLRDLSSRGRSVLQDGKQVQDATKAQEILTERLGEWTRNTLPMLQRARILI